MSCMHKDKIDEFIRLYTLVYVYTLLTTSFLKFNKKEIPGKVELSPSRKNLCWSFDRST